MSGAGCGSQQDARCNSRLSLTVTPGMSSVGNARNTFSIPTASHGQGKALQVKKADERAGRERGFMRQKELCLKAQTGLSLCVAVTPDWEYS